MHFHCGHQETAEEAHRHSSQQEIESLVKNPDISKLHHQYCETSCAQISDLTLDYF